MKNDDLLNELGKVAREQQQGQPAYTQNASTPSRTALRNRMVDMMVSASATEPSEGVEKPASLAPREVQSPGNLVVLNQANRAHSPKEKKRIWAIVAGVTAVLAAAAGVTLMLKNTRERDELAYNLPRYQITVRGGDTESRGEPKTPKDSEAIVRKVGRGARIVIELRPDSPVVGGINTTGTVASGNEKRDVKHLMQQDESGAVRLSSTAQQLFEGVSPGPIDVIITIEPAATSPHSQLSSGNPAGAQVFKTGFVYDANAP